MRAPLAAAQLLGAWPLSSNRVPGGAVQVAGPGWLTGSE